jgi:hypothetical protein
VSSLVVTLPAWTLGWLLVVADGEDESGPPPPHAASPSAMTPHNARFQADARLCSPLTMMNHPSLRMEAQSDNPNEKALLLQGFSYRQ